ncbi:MAG: class I mannose-6-phosphate isomerase [Planctomycetes bacterium]|nr:class I mannose-6-phosphate isomerase [Planctomycetota bacterium]
MNSVPVPVVFEPIFKPKPWGGRKLAELFAKRLPGDQPIGESWELAQLPGDESRVRDGPAAGKSISELIADWGDGFHGGALLNERFPLLVKFLDARENLSVQVHPKPDEDQPDRCPPGVKHECWYVVAARPDAEIFVGLKPNVTPADLAQAAGTSAIVDLLQRRRAKPGYCFFLPSGVPHALGAGVLVAEVQTPADVTYRLYDWDRVDAAGQRRELHIERALANVRFDIPDDQIRQPRRHVGSVFSTSTRMAACDRFVIEKVRIFEGMHEEVAFEGMTTWIMLRGNGVVASEGAECRFAAGDVLVIPAGARQPSVRTETDCEWLDVKVPLGSTLTGYARPPREAPPSPQGGPIQLTRSDR